MSISVKKIIKFLPGAYPLLGSFIVAFCWQWYHVPHSQQRRLILYIILSWALVYLAYRLFKALYFYLVKKFRRAPFWQNEFYASLDELFLVCSSVFLVFLSRVEIVSLIIFALALGAIFWRLDRHLRAHPLAAGWRAVNRAVAALAGFLFAVSGGLQYSAYHYYIFDPSVKFFNIVLFRSLAITMFWLLGFGLSGVVYGQLKSRWRYFGFIVWGALFLAVLLSWVPNLEVLYYWGLYFNPTIFYHTDGGSAATFIFSAFTIGLVLGFLALTAAFIYLLRLVTRAHLVAPRRFWHYYNFVLIFTALLALGGLSSWRTLPEITMLKSFYQRWFAPVSEIQLAPVIVEKLKRFGLFYEPDNTPVVNRDRVFSDPVPLLPENLRETRPNLVIIFFESFSARVLGPYNPNYAAVTPGLNALAADQSTTIVKKFYNASTPTVTGLLSELCGFLPPTGHEEIEAQSRLRGHRLLCLPKILRAHGYAYANYITAVRRDFANKDAIFMSMGTDEVLGTAELAKYVSGAPLSWGYSDHQMFPVLWQMMNDTKNQGPFLMMLSTVDSHPPYDLAKDAVNFGDGKNEVLNAIHTTDDAFAQFWTQFRASEFYNNTIVVAVADHAIFPQALVGNVDFNDVPQKLAPYDETLLMMYVPENILPKTVDMYSSGLDLTPTLLQVLGINVPNSFEGHSIFDDRSVYPNLLGMHEAGFYINQEVSGTGNGERGTSTRQVDFIFPAELRCADGDFTASAEAPLTLCEFQQFFNWKRQMLEQGRFWNREF